MLREEKDSTTLKCGWSPSLVVEYFIAGICRGPLPAGITLHTLVGLREIGLEHRTRNKASTELEEAVVEETTKQCLIISKTEMY